VAEAAITVADGYQGKGLGTLLLALLALAARAGGIAALRGYVLMENAQVRALLEQFGATTRIDAPGVLRVDVPVQAESLPDSAAARVLKALAARLGGIEAGKSGSWTSVSSDDGRSKSTAGRQEPHEPATPPGGPEWTPAPRPIGSTKTTDHPPVDVEGRSASNDRTPSTIGSRAGGQGTGTMPGWRSGTTGLREWVSGSTGRPRCW
jgi:hypothetical protein